MLNHHINYLQLEKVIKKVPETTKKQVNNAMGVYVAPETEYTSEEETTTTKEAKELNLVPSAASTYAQNENDIMPTSDYNDETSIVPEESYEWVMLKKMFKVKSQKIKLKPSKQ